MTAEDAHGSRDQLPALRARTPALDDQHLSPHDAGVGHPADERDRDVDVARARSEHEHERDDEDVERERDDDTFTNQFAIESTDRPK